MMESQRDNVTKKELVEEIASRSGLSQVETKIIIESFLNSISKALVDGKNIEIRGFGRFKLRMRNSRTARNPHTGEKVDVEAQIRPVFEASRELIRRMDARSADAAFLRELEP